MTALTDAFENALLDFILRGQPLALGSSTATWDAAPSFWVGLLTAAPNDSTGGTEVAAASYARVEIEASLASFCGTQGAGTTVASSGTSGETSNNGAVTFPAPLEAWGTVTHMGLYSAVSGGILLAYAQLAVPLAVLALDPAPSIPAGDLVFRLDT